MKITVFELAYRYVFPSVKKRLVEIMYREYGISQWRISRILGIDQSTVSRYLSGERGGLIDFSRYIDVDKNIQELASKIVREELDIYAVIYELVRLTLWIMSRGYICMYHKNLDPELDISRCNICLELFSDRKTGKL